jgi:hypothetical protein
LSDYLERLSIVILKITTQHPNQNDLTNLVFSPPPPHLFTQSFGTAICGWLEGQKTGGHEEIAKCAIVLVFSNPSLTVKNYTYNADSLNLTLAVNWLHSKGHTKIGNVLQHTWKTQPTVLLLGVNN